jgi:serine/threonine protein kinase
MTMLFEMNPVTATAPKATNERASTSARAGSLRWTLRAGMPDEMLSAVLENPDAFLADPARHFKNSRNVTVARIPRDGKTGWVLRRLNYGKPLHRLRDCFRPSRARRAFHNGLRLEAAGVATARVLAVCEVRRLGWPTRAYLLTEEIPGALTLKSLLKENLLSRMAVLNLADVLARLHGSGFSHRDLKAANVLFDDHMRAHLIDLDGVRYQGRLGQGRVVADLACLARDFAGHPQILKWRGRRFLRRYCLQRDQAKLWRRLNSCIAVALARFGVQRI